MGWQEDFFGNVKIYKNAKSRNTALKSKATRDRKEEAKKRYYDQQLTRASQSLASKAGVKFDANFKQATENYLKNKEVREDFRQDSIKLSIKREKAEFKSHASFKDPGGYQTKQYNEMRKAIGLNEDKMVTKKKLADIQSTFDRMNKFKTNKPTSNGVGSSFKNKDDKRTFPQKHPILHNILTFGMAQEQTKKDYKEKNEEKAKDSKNIYKNYLNNQLLNIPSLLEEKATGKKPSYLKDEVARKQGEDSSHTQDKINLALGSGALLKGGVKQLGRSVISKKGIGTAAASGTIGGASGHLYNKYQEQVGNKLSKEEKVKGIASNVVLGALLGKAVGGRAMVKETAPVKSKVPSQLLLDAPKPGAKFENAKVIDKLPNKEPTVMNIDQLPLNPKEAPMIKVANAQAKPVPKDYDSVKHIDEQISREVKPELRKPISQRVKDFAARTYYNMIDDAYGLARLDKAKGKSVRDSDSAVALAHRSRGSGAKAQQELEHGYFDKDGQKVGNSFSEILQKAKDPDKLETYLVSKGILDYDSKGNIALKTNNLDQLELSNKATKQLELENPNIVREAEEFYTYLKNQRNVLKEGGILNDAQIKQMEINNPNYVPMERERNEGIESFVGGNETLKKRFANVGNPVKKRTGSERKIISPFETTVKRQYVYNNMAERNKVGMSVLNHLREMPEDNPFGTVIGVEENAAFKVMKDADEIANRVDKEIPEKINEMFHEKDGDNNIINVYEDGNKYKIQVKDKMLFDSIMSLDSKSLPVWMNAVNLPVRMLRSGVTLSPDFAVRNFLRDQLTTGVTSRKGYIPFVDAFSGAFEIIKGREGNSELINAYTRNGGDLGLLQNIDRANNIKSLQELKGNVPLMQKLKKIKEDPTLILEPLRKMGEFSERSTRIGHMKKAVRKGESLEQAAYEARSTMDFNRAGRWGRQINQGVAFFNAALQGMDVLARSVKDNPASTLKNIGLYVALPTYGLYMLNKDQQWFKDMPEEERDRNWFIQAGNEIIKIPKPFEVGILFGAGLERGLDKVYNGEGGEFDGYLKELAGAFSPDIIPTAVKPLLEVYTNKSFFTGNAIDTLGESTLPAKDRYNAYNSQFSIRTANLLSKVKPNTEISPKDIDNLVRGYTGTLGTTVTETADKIEGLVNPNIPERPQRGLQTTPFVRSLMVKNLEGNNKPTNDFYKLFEDLRSMKKVQGDKFKYPDQKSMVERTYKQISDLQKLKKSVLNSTTLSGKEKSKQIKEYNEQITEAARQANQLKIPR